jgi:hypothetical protein
LSAPFTPLKALEPELVEQLKRALPGPLFDHLNGSLTCDQERLHLAECKVRLLEERLRLIRLNKYGPGSETLSDAQLELLEVEPGVSVAEVAAESHREPLIAPRPAKPPARPHPGRQQLPAELPRVERLIACTPEQCICGQCGKPTRFIGYEQSEHLDVEPVKYFVVVTKREKRACQSCEEQGVACAPLPARIISERLGQRSGGHRHGGAQIRRFSTPLSPECDFGTRDGPFDQPGDFGRLSSCRWATYCGPLWGRCGRNC